jgi:periplasmic divalent cation tolerance protein
MSTASKVTLTLTTLATETDADALTHALLKEGLAACVSRIGNVRSTYHWQGAVEQNVEVLLLIKHASLRTAALAKRVKELHPYETPELLHFEAQGGLAEYMAWVTGTSQNESGPAAS